MVNSHLYLRLQKYWNKTDTVLSLRVFGISVSFGNKFGWLVGLLVSNCLLFVLKSVVIPFVEAHSHVDL